MKYWIFVQEIIFLFYFQCNLITSLFWYTIIIIIRMFCPRAGLFTSISGTKAAVLPKCRSSTANSWTMVAVLLGKNRCSSFPIAFCTLLSSAFEQTLKDPRGTYVEVRRVVVQWYDNENWFRNHATGILPVNQLLCTLHYYATGSTLSSWN